MVWDTGWNVSEGEAIIVCGGSVIKTVRQEESFREAIISAAISEGIRQFSVFVGDKEIASPVDAPEDFLPSEEYPEGIQVVEIRPYQKAG